MDKYDLVVSRPDGDSIGYMFSWGENEAPAVFASDPPDVPISTSTALVQSGGGAFTARDAAPPYPVELNDWRGGAGQESYDWEESLYNAFRSSNRMDVTQRGHFELGPHLFTPEYTDIRNVVGFALGTFWASFTPASSDPRNSLRYLARAKLTQSGSLLAGGVSLVVDDGDNLVDLSPFVLATVTATAGDYVYCPSTGEVAYVNSVFATNQLQLSRGQGGTTAAGTADNTEWVLLHWTPVTFAATDPSQFVTALTDDGEYVYAAFHTPGSDNGTVWRGKASATDWTQFSAVNNIVDLTYCAGYLYGTQENYTASTRTAVGWFNTSGTFSVISLYQAFTPRSDAAGLTSVGNYVYWGAVDGSRGRIYRVQHSSEDLFEAVADMPPGFVISTLLGHLGQLYVGGYIDTLVTDVADTDLPRYEGALYIIGGDGQIARLFRIKDASDGRIKGLSTVGPFILCLGNEDVYVYDTSTGSYSHYADTPTGSLSGVTEDIDWLTNGFTSGGTGAWLGNLAFMYGTGLGEYLSEDTPNSSGDENPTGQDWVAVDYASGHNLTLLGDSFEIVRVDAGKFLRWRITEGTLPATEVIKMPTNLGTLEFGVSDLASQAGTVVVGLDSKEVRVKMQGVYSGGAVVGHRFFLGYATDPACTIPLYDYNSTGLLAIGEHTVRLTFGGFGARMYVDGDFVASTEYSQLRNADVANSLALSVGWPGDAQSDTYREKIQYHGIRYTPDGAYPPDYTGGTVITADMKGISNAQGWTLIPVPGESMAIIDQQNITDEGWLRTSESSFHMGSTDKYFVDTIVRHSKLLVDQTLEATTSVDGAVAGAEAGAMNDTETVVRVQAKGKKVETKVTLADANVTRAYVDRLRVYSITNRFFLENSPHVYTLFVNCRKGVQCRDGKDWPFDPESAIRHLFEAADSGEVVNVASLFSREPAAMRIESVKLVEGPSDMEGYSELVGTVAVKMRRLDNG